MEATPVTTPLVFTVAAAVLLLLQTPFAVPSARVVVEPTQTVPVPVIDATKGVPLTAKLVEVEAVHPLALVVV